MFWERDIIFELNARFSKLPCKSPYDRRQLITNPRIVSMDLRNLSHHLCFKFIFLGYEDSQISVAVPLNEDTNDAQLSPNARKLLSHDAMDELLRYCIEVAHDLKRE